MIHSVHSQPVLGREVETLQHLYDHIMSQPDVEIILLMMGILSLFAGGVFGWFALRATRPIRHKRRARREYKREQKRQARNFRKMKADGRIASMAAKQQEPSRPQRDWGKEAEEKFGDRAEAAAESDSEDELEITGEFTPVGEDTEEMAAISSKVGATAAT